MNRRGNGEGNIYQRADSLWVGRMSLGCAAGKRQRKVVYGKTRREAAERLTAVLRARQQGLPIAKKRLSLATYLAQWLTSVRPTVRGSTWRRYEIIVRCQLIPHLGRLSLVKLAPSDLAASYTAMLSHGLAPRTVGHAHRVLGRALREAEVAGLVGRNVARIVRAPYVPQREMQTFSAEQCRTLLRSAEGDRLAALYQVALGSGARQWRTFERLRNGSATLTGRSRCERTRTSASGSRLRQPKLLKRCYEPEWAQKWAH